MKKRIFLLIFAILCSFLVLCACSEEENAGGGSESSNVGNGGSNTQGSGGSVTQGSGNNTGVSGGGTGSSGDHDHDHDHNDPNVSAPETNCALNEKGHYWYNVAINKNTNVDGSIILTGKCHLCGENISKQAVSLVTYEEWKEALSATGLSSFTTVLGNEYTDYDENGSASWRIENNTYSVDYFINSSSKNNTSYINNFKGFALQFNDFKYDSQSKTYVYWLNESSYIELGFADGRLLSHSMVSKTEDKEEKSTTLFLNHQRVSVSVPAELIQKYTQATTLEALKESTSSLSDIERICGELGAVNFDFPFELSLLENDQMSVYFTLDRPKQNPFSTEESYSSISVILKDGRVSSVLFDSFEVAINYN